MKYKIVIECEDEEELEIIKSAKTNYFVLKGLYDECFRNSIKHGDQKESEMYETVWEKVNEHIKERE